MAFSKRRSKGNDGGAFSTVVGRMPYIRPGLLNALYEPTPKKVKSTNRAVKYSDDEIIEMRRMHEWIGMTASQIAKIKGLSQAYARQITEYMTRNNVSIDTYPTDEQRAELKSKYQHLLPDHSPVVSKRRAGPHVAGRKSKYNESFVEALKEIENPVGYDYMSKLFGVSVGAISGWIKQYPEFAVEAKRLTIKRTKKPVVARTSKAKAQAQQFNIKVYKIQDGANAEPQAVVAIFNGTVTHLWGKNVRRALITSDMEAAKLAAKEWAEFLGGHLL